MSHCLTCTFVFLFTALNIFIFLFFDVSFIDIRPNRDSSRTALRVVIEKRLFCIIIGHCMVYIRHDKPEQYGLYTILYYCSRFANNCRRTLIEMRNKDEKLIVPHQGKSIKFRKYIKERPKAVLQVVPNCLVEMFRQPGITWSSVRSR